MPNPSNDFQTFFRGVLVTNSTSCRQGRTEKYLMSADNWDDAAAQLEVLAKCRAMIMGRDAEVSYASVAQWGAARAAQAVITSPIKGGLGVLWDDATYLDESDLNTNNPGVSLRIRQENALRNFIMRHVTFIPDALINASKYVGSTPPDVLDLSGYAVPTAHGAFVLPTQTLWVYGTSVAGVTTHITWQAAMKLYAKALHNLTVWGKLITPSTAQSYAWTNMLYRAVGRVRMGRPITR